MNVGGDLLLIGPNRRSDRTMIERQIELTDFEIETVSARLMQLLDSVVSSLKALAVESSEFLSPHSIESDDVLGSFAQLCTGTALALQCSAGHRVHERGYSLDSAGQGVWSWFEYEHDEVGEQALQLTLRLLSDLEPGLDWASGAADANEKFSGLYERFLKFSRPLALPLDAEAIMTAAQRLDVPYFKLERAPYSGVRGKFRIRQNGLLRLGHCGHQQLVDGTFCVSRNKDLAPLLLDREALRQKLLKLQVALPARDAEAGNCIVSRRALRAADRIGYPVVVKPGTRAAGKGVTLDVRNAEEVRAAVERARPFSSHVTVEAMVSGESFRLLAANHAVLGVIHAGKELALGAVHETTLQLASRISRHLNSGMLVLDIVTMDPGRPLAETGGAVVDVDLAPELDALLPAGSSLLGQAAEAFIRWLYPAGSASRVPIAAVTGTNGKTTTCRMIARIMQVSGRHTGMVCSDGIYIDEKFEATRGDIGYGAHHSIFECPSVDFVVLEEYFGRIARLGFSFHWCNVAVCTNVTEDHLGRIGVHALEEMAEIKFALPKRARDAVVLNADDLCCRQMAARATSRKICLVSCEQSVQQLEMIRGNACCFCVVEELDGRNWIVIYDTGVRRPLIAVEDVPATFSGAAMHNTSNAMHAAAACYLSGASIEEIASGLATFIMGFESTPARLNVYDGLPFRVIVDYAHNADGFRRLSAFIDKQQVAGRKIIMMSMAGDRRDRDIMAAMAKLAGHFDHYVCRSYVDLRGRPAEDVPRLLKAGLLEAGVPESAISTVPNAIEAVLFSLNLATEGDLLVLLSGNEIATIWSLLRSFGTGAEVSPGTADLPATPPAKAE